MAILEQFGFIFLLFFILFFQGALSGAFNSILGIFLKIAI
jgi:hypothetical protein